ADPFLVAVTPIAMACAEPVEVRGAVSPRLAWGVREFQGIHRLWFPRHVSAVEIHTSRLEEPPPGERGAGVAAGFSGGVDSMHTTWRHSAGREPLPGFRLTHAL